MSARQDKLASRAMSRIASICVVAAMPLWFAGVALVAAPTATRAMDIATPKGEPDRTFFTFPIKQDFQGAPDVSTRLHRHPLGPQDMIVRSGAHFVTIGAGTPTAPAGERIKLYGINLSFAANFPSSDMAPIVAKRLRAQGFNAVRLHHMDTKPGNETPPGSILTTGPFPTLNPEAVTRLRALIAALAQEGIYVDLNLRVGYPFRPDVDAVPALPDSGETAPLHIFHPRMRALQADYARQLIAALGLAHNPALAMVEINNESSLAYTYEKGQLSKALNAPYKDVLKGLWRVWLKKRDPNSTDAYADLRMTSSMAMRTEEFAAFLRDTDAAYLDEMRRVVVEAAGWPVPVTGTQMGYGGQAYVSSHANMDYLDEHFYIDHYSFPGVAWARTDWRFLDNDVTRAELQRKLAASYARRDPQRPWVVSEYNMAFPNQQGAAIVPVVAGLALAGDWDALYFFDYADGKVWNQAADSFTLSGDPAKLALTGQAAQLFLGDKPAGLAPDWAYDNGQQQDLFLLDTPKAVGAFGRLGTDVVRRSGALEVRLAASTRGYATVLLSSLDDMPVGPSRHLLLTHVGGVRGSEPASEPLRPKAIIPADKTTKILAPDEHGAPGPGGPRDATGPMWLEKIPAQIALHTIPGISWTIYPLDPQGQRQTALRHSVTGDGLLSFAIHDDAQSLTAWYELVGTPAETRP